MFSVDSFNHTTNEVFQIDIIKKVGKKFLKVFLNLKVFVHWSSWSTCDNLRKIRTRKGLKCIFKVFLIFSRQLSYWKNKS